MNHELKLLVEWSSPWEEFVTAIRPALSRSARPLDAETQSGLFPYRTGLAAMALEAVLLVALIVLPSKLARMQPFQPAPPPQYDVIYFSGNELPRTEDNGGARSGRSGQSGGSEGHHATQVIRVARGPLLRDQVVDAPKLNLPHSDSAVQNLLAYKSVPGPPPATGLEASSRLAAMQAAVIPPPVAMQSEKLHSAPTMEASVVAPSPTGLQNELTSRRVSSSRMDAVPPPESAPREVRILNPKLTLPPSMVVRPAPSQLEHESSRARFNAQGLTSQEVVAPAPDATNGFTSRQTMNVGDASVVAPATEVSNVSARRMPGSMGDSSIVPPPAQVNGSLMRQMNGISQTASVVQPSPSASSITNSRRAAGGLGDSRAVPPTAQVSGALTRQLNGISQAASVVQPSPTAPSSSVSSNHRAAGGFEEAKVVPPTAQAGGSFERRGTGLSQSNSVVEPPPSASSGSGSNGQSRHGPGDTMADAVVPPSPGLASGIVLSSRPGSKLAAPSGSAGSMAMSPSGGATPGLGGTGGGTGISHGSGSGSSISGTGSGATTSGSGQGSNETAHNGISPFPGVGGAGKGTLSPPAMPGVSVSGGSNRAITLPSFGTDKPSPADSSHSPAINAEGGPGITVVATSHSGGAFNFYGALKGDKVYTIYIDTTLGTAVMQFADPKSANQNYPEELTAPQALRAELPTDVSPSRLVIACTLDRSGLLKTARVLEGNSPELSEKVLAELPKWKFRPAFRGSEPVEVNAILGFDIDTR